MKNRFTLLVMAKEPVPGQTKTRLSPSLTPAECASLSSCFLQDVLDLVRRATSTMPDLRPVICYLPETAAAYFSSLAPDFFRFPQVGATLGERLDHALAACLDNAAQGVVVIGSDSPNLPIDYVLAAFEAVASGIDVVLGPAEDGGYYLMGLTRPAPRLLRKVTMSTPHVLQDTLALARAENLSIHLLPAWYDIDTPADLARLARELNGAHETIAPATRAFLAEDNGLIARLQGAAD
jgi:uncharacterized protein